LCGRAVDDIIARLADFEIDGIEEQPDAVAAYFQDRETAQAVADEFAADSPEEMEDRNWSAELQDAWQPIAVGARFFLCPPWMDVVTPPGRIHLAMIPGNVFGGGDHPTTQLCLELLETLIQPGQTSAQTSAQTIADIGAGTGILTRAARALGARAYGCDIDPASAPLVDILGSADSMATTRFDGIIANIHLAVHRQLRPEFLRLARPGAWLLASGFLPEQAPEMEALFGPAQVLNEKGGWCAALFVLAPI
jgi:ribosomal protein L11 methyltransferase